MYWLDDFFERIIVFQIIIDLFNVFIGMGLCFGALKWRKGLIASVAAYWGLFLGITLGLAISSQDAAPVIICGLVGVILIPILTYNVSGVNRFIVGFIVASKLAFMVTTVLMRQNQLDIGTMFSLPLIIGTIVGLFLMVWTKMRVSAFVAACAFIGASQIAPTIAKYIHQIQYGFTGDIGYIFDVYDIIFGIFKIELTDGITLIAMLILMPIGIFKQLQSVKAQGYDYSTPIITYETNKKDMHGKILPR